MKKLIFAVLLLSGSLFAEIYNNHRMGKKDREDMVALVAEPIRKIEQKIDSINQAANQIQNIIIDKIQAQGHDAALVECCGKIQERLGQIELVIKALVYLVQSNVQQTEDIVLGLAQLENATYELALQIATLNQTVGSVTDLSVGEESFNSVEDIDNAQLSAISWLKTIYREQLHDKFIS